jgi:hypothetical protein
MAAIDYRSMNDNELNEAIQSLTRKRNRFMNIVDKRLREMKIVKDKRGIKEISGIGIQTHPYNHDIRLVHVRDPHVCFASFELQPGTYIGAPTEGYLCIHLNEIPGDRIRVEASTEEEALTFCANYLNQHGAQDIPTRAEREQRERVARNGRLTAAGLLRATPQEQDDCECRPESLNLAVCDDFGDDPDEQP